LPRPRSWPPRRCRPSSAGATLRRGHPDAEGAPAPRFGCRRRGAAAALGAAPGPGPAGARGGHPHRPPRRR
jgi:hypothetical protein